MDFKEPQLKVKFDYDGQKRAILMPQPLRYHQLIEKLRQLCGSKFTIEYSAAEGEFIREIECQEDLDDVVTLTKASVTTNNCLPLKLVRCSKPSSSDRLSSFGDAQVSSYSSLSSVRSRDSGGFFHSELPEVFPASKLEQLNSDYIPESHDSHQNSFIPDPSAYQSSNSCRYNAKNRWDAKKQMAFVPSNNSSKTYVSTANMTPCTSQETDSGCPRSRVEIFHQSEKKEAADKGQLPTALNALCDGKSDGVNSVKTLENKMENLCRSGFIPGRWVKGRLLGQGAFGQVFTGYDIDRGIEFAVKQVQIYAESDEVEQQIEALEMEISVLQGVHHSHIVEYYGMQREPNCLSIFIEFIPMGSLKDHLNRYGCLTENVTALYTNQILKGLTYLHSKMIIHRDIKSANILRDHHGNLKLGDFGASKLLQSQSVAATSKIAGTPYFMAPEIIRGEACGCRCDIWSLGCTVVEMLTKNPPWHQYDAIAAIYKIGSTWPPEYSLPDEMSTNVRNFLESCFAEAATDRPKAVELLSHEFIVAALSC